MKCPYCKDKMKEGLIEVYDTLSWSPKGKKRRGATRLAVAEGGVVLAENRFLFSASKEAFYCPKCNKIIIETD